jgi:hypothetical protein
VSFNFSLGLCLKWNKKGQIASLIQKSGLLALYTQLPELGSPHLSSGGGKATKRLQPL